MTQHYPENPNRSDTQDPDARAGSDPLTVREVLAEFAEREGSDEQTPD